MTFVTETQLNNASTDAQTLEDVVNGAADLNGDGSLSSRLGTTLKTLAKLIAEVQASSDAAVVDIEAERDALVAAIGSTDVGEIKEVGTQNVFVGSTAGNITVTGVSNTTVGAQSLPVITSGADNSAFGRRALFNLTTGISNSAIGVFACTGVTSGSNNMGMGTLSLRFNQEGSSNVAIGSSAGAGTSNHNKSGGVFIGFEAGKNEMGSNKLYIANSSTATPLIGGDFSTSQLTINGKLNIAGAGTNNLFISSLAGDSVTSGTSNVALGHSSLSSLITASFCVAVGYEALRDVAGGSNIGIGYRALANTSGGGNNVAIGTLAGQGTPASSKSGGVFIGYRAGESEDGDNKLYIANSNTATPLVGGDFSAGTLSLNAAVTVSQSLSLTHGAERSAASGAGAVWTASGSGTKDGTAYEAGDVLVTSNVGGVSKTAILLDHSLA